MFDKRFITEAKATLQLAIPIIIAQFGVILMGVTDNIMIGRLLGKNELGASGLANSIAFLISSLAVGGLPVVAPMISKALAAEKLILLKDTFLASVFASIIYAFVITGISILIFLNFNILHQSAIINSLSKPFFLIILLSNIPLIAFIALKQTTDGLSRPKIAMYITFLGLFFNIVMNYTLIKGVGIFPAYGLNGAAWSTLFVRIIMLLVLIIFLIRYPVFEKIENNRSNINEVKFLTKKILSMSIPGGLQFFFEIGAFSFAVIMMGWISENALAAHQIAINIAATTYMMASGIGFAGGIRVGNALGRKSLKAVRLSGNVAFTMVFIFMTLCMLIIFTFKNSLISLYINDDSITHIASALLVIAAIFQLSDGIQVVALGTLRGMSDVNVPAWITFIAYWVIALPTGYYLGFVQKLGAVGIWIALLGGLTVAAIFLTIRFYTILNKRMEKVRQSDFSAFD